MGSLLAEPASMHGRPGRAGAELGQPGRLAPLKRPNLVGGSLQDLKQAALPSSSSSGQRAWPRGQASNRRMLHDQHVLAARQADQQHQAQLAGQLFGFPAGLSQLELPAVGLQQVLGPAARRLPASSHSQAHHRGQASETSSISGPSKHPFPGPD